MESGLCPSAAERLYGLSLVWQEVNYNFAFFGRQPNLDWDSLYKQYIPLVISAQDLLSYYSLLSRFMATLRDGHSLVVPPKSLFLELDRPKLMLMNVQNKPVVTNASSTIGRRVPIGSQILEVDDKPAEQYLSEHVMPYVSESTDHRLRDHAVSRMLLGRRDSTVRCDFRAPDGAVVQTELCRNRATDADPWLRMPGVPDKWEFMYFDEWFYSQSPSTPYTAFRFDMLDGNIAYVALNSFMDPAVVTSFREKMPAMRQSSGLILDLRKNHGGNDAIGYGIAAHLLKQPTEVLVVRSPKHIASHRASGASLKHTPPEAMETLDDGARDRLLCYRRQWLHEEQWGNVSPCDEVLSLPSAILTDSETNSAAEDFVMALQSGKAGAVRIGGATAGSSGQPLIEDLPGGGMMGICTIRMPWPEPTWTKGIEPDIRVEPTVEDVIRDQDRILAEAVRFLRERRS